MLNETKKTHPTPPNENTPQKASPIFTHLEEREEKNAHTNDTQAIEEIIYPDIKLQSNKKYTPYMDTSSTEKTKLFQPENWRCLQAIPCQYRRLAFVLFIFTLFVIFVSLIKPQNTTVQSFDNENVFQLDNTNSNNQALGDLSSILASQDIALNTPQEMPSTPTPNTSAKESTTQPPAPTTPQNNQATLNDVFTAAEKANLLANAEQNTAPKTQTTTAENPKILIIRKGVTLTQLFREHHLKIGDIIAMSNVPNAGKQLNRLRPKAKIYVYLTPEGNVSKMVLPNGGYFIREAHQHYRYQG